MSISRLIGGRRIALVLAAVFQTALLLAVASPRLSPRLFGDTYRFAAQPVDPIDPFRGAYVDIDYRDIPASDSLFDGDVFIPLERSGDLWRGGPPSESRPASGPYLACHSDGHINCGIESLFLSQEKAAALGRELAESGGVATVKVDGAGRAALVDVDPH